jgi:hypothetical protein
MIGFLTISNEVDTDIYQKVTATNEIAGEVLLPGEVRFVRELHGAEGFAVLRVKG